MFTNPDDKDNILENGKIEALKTVNDMIANTADSNHKLSLYDLSLLTPEDISRSNKPCPYCLAFSYWYHIISKIPYSAHYKTLEKFSIYAGAIPTPPVPMNLVFSEGNSYILGQSFTSQLYAQDLMTCFVKIFNDVIYLLQNIESGISKKDFFIKPINPDDYKDLSLFYKIVDKSLAVQYSYTAQDPKKLTPPKNISIDCDSFRDYTNNKRLASLDNTWNVKCGLTKDEYMTLRYGYDFIIKHNKRVL